MYFKEFHVTGISRSGKRCKVIKFQSYSNSLMIAFWKGSVWGVDEKGKRTLLKRIYNP